MMIYDCSSSSSSSQGLNPTIQWKWNTPGNYIVYLTDWAMVEEQVQDELAIFSKKKIDLDIL